MSLSTNLISGLSSGFDWRSMIDQLIAIDRGRVDLIEDRKSEYESKLAEWQNVNTMLLSLKTASGALSTESAFNVFSSSTTSSSESGTPTAASSLLTVSTSSTASPALYNIKVNNLAQSEKISSTNYTATDTALELEGDILVSGKVVNIVSTDTLADVKDKINAVNTGSDPSNVTASIVSYSSTNYHLILTSDETGEDGLNVLEGASGGDNILEEMGFISGSTAIKTATSDGAKSDLFDSSSGVVATLLGLTNAPGATTVQIGGNDISINLSTQSITTIAQNIDALAGISAEVVSETVSGETKYRIDISGTTSFTDSGHVLQTLGILEGTYGSVDEVHSGSVNYKSGGGAIEDATTWANIFTGALRGDVANTKVAGGSITASTTWVEIDTDYGAPASNDFNNDETITVSGKDHDGNAVNETYSLVDKGGEALSVFLGQLETWFGGSDKVDAYFDSNGRLIVEDLQSGSSELSVTVTPNNTALKFNTVSADPFGNNITDGIDTITISGTKHDGSTITTTNFTINTADALNKATTGFLVTIEDLYGGDTKVDAYISDGTDGNTAGQIVLKDLEAGESQITLTLICNNNDGGTLNFGEISMTTEGRDMQVAAGEDAEIVVDNVTITNSSNTITDVIAGTTLNLVGEDSNTTVTLKIERDLASIKSKIEDMVSAYNSIMDYINIQFTYDEDTEQVGGILFGDGTLSTIKSELINTVTRTITGASSDYNKLALIGISLDVVDTDEGEYNKLNLVIDDDDLMDYLETNFDDVRKLFIASGSSPYSNLTYISHTDDTEGGAYNVTISQPATRGTTTGNSPLAGQISDNEKVTLTDFATGRVATVNLTTDMYINDVVNAINSEFAKEYTEQLTGATETGVIYSTLFNDALVEGENNDVITFSGTRRNGISVSGSYTISDATTETVGDLLEAIEDMYEDEVTVALDGSGKIVITDTQAGDSNLSLYIDTSALGTLDFGTVSTTTTGRYAMNITASEGTGADDNKLVLTHNTYGTGQQVTTKSEDGNDDLGLNNATKVWGGNVAGTINGLTATGSGQRLSLDSDGNNADGLSISYTGTSTIAETTFTLTLGIGELLDRRLGFITNTSDGYVTYKKTSLGNSIDSFEDQIENMEARLNRKMENMINKFVAMELALAKIQNQSQWLMAQISGSFSGWGSL